MKEVGGGSFRNLQRQGRSVPGQCVRVSCLCMCRTCMCVAKGLKRWNCLKMKVTIVRPEAGVG